MAIFATSDKEYAGGMYADECMVIGFVSFSCLYCLVRSAINALHVGH